MSDHVIKEIGQMCKFIVVSLWFIVNLSCGDSSDIRTNGKDAQPCTVVQQDTGAIISCPDGSTAEVIHGNNGNNGVNGVDGSKCSVYDSEDGALIECEDGSSVTIKDGTNGKNGKNYNTEPIYIGYYCSRNVLRISNRYYILNSNLVLLSESWYPVSNSCKVRRINGNIEVM